MRHFCVLGSLNMDMVTRVTRFPRPGETISGISFNIFPGGKGANQAVALARLGAAVEMVGAVGDDVLGARYEAVLDDAGVGRGSLARIAGVSTGTASIEVTTSGENHIVVVAGANEALTPAFVEARRDRIEDASFLLLQLEIPMESVLAAAHIAAAAGVPVMLDPAPARPLPPELYPLLSIITPNEHEAAILTDEDTRDDAGIARAGAALLARGVRCAVIKAGSRGAFVVDAAGTRRVPGFAVHVVDTVAAGDSFNAGLAFALSRAASSAAGNDAVRFANAVGALSTTKEGAQSAMPTEVEVFALLESADKA
jgi:ribokinase